MLERDVEKHLRKRVRELGGLCLKFVSPGRRNVVDRLCLLPKGLAWLVELKRPGAKARAAQVREHKRYAERGHNVAVLATKAEVDEWFLNRLLDLGRSGSPGTRARPAP